MTITALKTFGVNIDFEDEFATIGDALRQVVVYLETLTTPDTLTLGALLSKVQPFDITVFEHENLHLALEAINILLDLELLDHMLVPLYNNNFKAMITSMLGGFAELANLDHYSTDAITAGNMIIEEIKSIVNSRS